MTTKKELVQFLLAKKILVTGKLMAMIKEQTEQETKKVYEAIQSKDDEDIRKIIFSYLQAEKQKEQQNKRGEEETPSEVNSAQEKNKEVTNNADEEEVKEGTVSIISSFTTKEVNKEIQDFVSYFNERYKALERLLRGRQELDNVTVIKRALQKEEREHVAIIGIVKEIDETKNNNLIVTLEDSTGEMKALISKNKREIYEGGKSLVRDEVIGIVGVAGKGIIFVEKIVWPEVPVYNELKKSPIEEYAIFLSDIHVGSKQFLAPAFEKFLKWINGEAGDEKQRALVKKIKYIFIIGDVVDGVGIYPGQEHDLEMTNIYDQYAACGALLAQIPKHMKIIICPGNHDAMRLAEPQLPLYEDMAKPLYDLPNVMMVSNPAMVNVGRAEGFPGISVLMYHGYSFDYYIANVDEIRNNGGNDRADLVMKYLLQRRHLAPTHASCVYIPFRDSDPMIINKIPDIFATGHLHKTSVSSYRNITLICGSCWQGKTAFQEKMGHNPEPARVPLVNLQTREVKILRFME